MSAGDATAETQRSKLVADDAGVSRLIGCNAGGSLQTLAHNHHTFTSDELLNDALKTITVPANELWWVHMIHIVLTTTATVGNRQLTLQIQHNGTLGSLEIPAGATQAASLTNQYTWFPGAPLPTAFIDDSIMMPLPPRLILPAAADITIFDAAVIAIGADDMLFRIVHDTYTV